MWDESFYFTASLGHPRLSLRRQSRGKGEAGTDQESDHPSLSPIETFLLQLSPLSFELWLHSPHWLQLLNVNSYKSLPFSNQNIITWHLSKLHTLSSLLLAEPSFSKQDPTLTVFLLSLLSQLKPGYFPTSLLWLFFLWLSMWQIQEHNSILTFLNTCVVTSQALGATSSASPNIGTISTICPSSSTFP